MTKAENRAAARAYHQQKQREPALQIQIDHINAHLAELDRLRHYLIFQERNRRAAGSPSLGDRRALHGQGNSIG